MDAIRRIKFLQSNVRGCIGLILDHWSDVADVKPMVKLERSDLPDALSFVFMEAIIYYFVFVESWITAVGHYT